jgi:hypothetical protein
MQNWLKMESGKSFGGVLPERFQARAMMMKPMQAANNPVMKAR